jgi:hypothetical protein
VKFRPATRDEYAKAFPEVNPVSVHDTWDERVFDYYIFSDAFLTKWGPSNVVKTFMGQVNQSLVFQRNGLHLVPCMESDNWVARVYRSEELKAAASAARTPSASTEALLLSDEQTDA